MKTNGIKFVFLLMQCVIAGKDESRKCPELKEGCPSQLVKFYFFSDINDNQGTQLLLEDPKTIEKASFHLEGDIKFIIHGCSGNYNDLAMTELRHAYLRNGIQKVVTLDYHEIAPSYWNYFHAIKCLPAIGKCGAELVCRLLQLRPNDIQIEQFHVIGFSLGAHLAAQIANHLETNCKKQLQRVTGLDPPSSLLHSWHLPNKDLLNKQHAKFVDVIHTNIYGIGVSYSNAHIDAYANNGKYQPRCSFRWPLCSHAQALVYFVDTIFLPTAYPAQKCKGSPISVLLGRCARPSKDSSGVIFVGESCTAPAKKDEGKYLYVFHTSKKKPPSTREQP